MEILGLIGLIITSIMILYVLFKWSVKKSVTMKIQEMSGTLTNQINVANNALNFNRDIEFLEFIISFKLENTKNIIIEPLSLTHLNSKFISDEQLNTFVNDTVADIEESLNDGYRLILYKYFTEESLGMYIAERVYIELAEYVISINRR